MKKLQERIDVPASLVLMGLMLVWSSAPLFLRQFFWAEIPVWDQNIFRYIILLLLLWPTVWWVYLRGERGRENRLTGKVWRATIEPGVWCFLAQIFFSWSLYFIQPGLMSLLHKQSVIYAVLCGAIFFRDERVLLRDGRFWGGLVCTLSGSIGVVAFAKDVDWGGQVVGVVFVSLAALVWAFYTVSIRRMAVHVKPILGYAIVATYTTVPLAVLSVVLGKPVELFGKGSSIWVLLILSTVLNLYLPHMGVFWVVPRVGVAITNTCMLSTAFVTAFFSWLIFSEELTKGQWLCGVVLIFGAFLTLLSQESFKNRGMKGDGEGQ